MPPSFAWYQDCASDWHRRHVMSDVTGRPRYFHVTCWLTRPEAYLQKTAHYRALLGKFRNAIDTSEVRLLAFCLLPRAWHLVVEAKGITAVESLTSRVVRSHRGEPRRPTGIVLTPLATAGALVGHCVTVERRPVAVGLVRQAQDWPWCSAAERFRLQTRLPLLSPRILMSDAWLKHLNSPRPGDASSGIGRHDLAKAPSRLARSTEVSKDAIQVGFGAHEDHTHAHIERAEHLRLGHTASGLKPLEKRRHGPPATIQGKRESVR
jgi:hypothetical protein